MLKKLFLIILAYFFYANTAFSQERVPEDAPASPYDKLTYSSKNADKPTPEASSASQFYQDLMEIYVDRMFSFGYLKGNFIKESNNISHWKINKLITGATSGDFIRNGQSKTYRISFTFLEEGSLEEGNRVFSEVVSKIENCPLIQNYGYSKQMDEPIGTSRSCSFYYDTENPRHRIDVTKMADLFNNGVFIVIIFPY